MCAKLSTFPPELVAYYNFDEVGTATVKDLSSLRLNGTLKNMSTSMAWVTSGAPIGDRSVFRYTNRWDASLEMVTDIANFYVVNVDPAIQGFHLYAIQSPPASTSGFNNPQEVTEYYGLFKVGDVSKKYKVYHKQYGKSCGGNLYRRPDNTVANWTQVADTADAAILLYSASANYGEFAATSITPPSVTINGPANVCAGATATLNVLELGSRQVRWSTGETTFSIKVTESGTYAVEVTSASGCTATDELEVSFAQAPDFSYPVEMVTCFGEQVTLDATTEGATYTWSSGQTTPSITVTSPAIYTVTLQINDCSYERKLIVSSVECPIIPNIITPNEDGKNDAFVVQGVEPNTLDLEVFNRWGKSMYQRKQYDNSWPAAAMPPGIYYYLLTSRRTQQVFKGWVEVAR